MSSSVKLAALFGERSSDLLSTTARLIVPCAKPPPFVATTVYVFGTVTAVGVPEIWPVVALNVRPAGSDGLIVKTSGTPPVTVGEIGVSATSVSSGALGDA